MPTVAKSFARASDLRPEPLTAVYSVRLTRNMLIQSLVILMTSLTALTVGDWPPVAVWTAVMLAAATLEDVLLRRAAEDDNKWARRLAPATRIFITCAYAYAALILIALGGPDAKLFALVLMACSMVYLLMRYYRSPLIFLAGVAPYALVLGLIGFDLVRKAIEKGDTLAVLTPISTMAMFALLFWGARAQLSNAWLALMQARAEAEQRERAAEAANRAKSHFLAAMSHELRTPLNGVLGMAQAMTAEDLSAPQRERLKIIRRSSENLLSVLNDLLDLSKIEASELELEIVEFDMEHLVRGVGAAFAPMAAKKGLAFDFSVSPGATGHYLGDSARIRRILYNLASNAVKFTDKGGVTVAISRGDDGLVMAVSDTGIGIAPEHMANLFDDFFQADGSMSRRHGGAGLGLAICRELAALMGGSIGAASTEGQGSTFELKLPLERAAHVAPPAPEAAGDQAQGEEAEGPPLRVLAAEDNEVNQIVIRTLLNQAGIEPVMVENGRLALEAWEREDWDIILMDIQMPEMDGLTATRVIRRREHETGRARTPIVAVTANAMTHQVAEYEGAGMDGVVPKPLEIERLFAAMDEALTAKEAAAAA